MPTPRLEPRRWLSIVGNPTMKFKRAPFTVPPTAEHFDERIDAVAPSGIFIDSNVMPKGSIAIEIEEATERSQLRNYDPSTETLTFWTDEIRARDVVSELVLIGLATGHFRPLPFMD